MKIFGINISRRKKQSGFQVTQSEVIPQAMETVQDAQPKKQSQRTVQIIKLPRVKNPALSFKLRPGTDEFEQPEYNMSEIGRIVDVESYVQQAFTQKEGLMFKEGWEIVGKNLQTIKYIKQRFEQLTAATGEPFSNTLRGVGEDLIRYSNAFLVKVRNIKASGGRRRRLFNKTVEPVAGYFALPVSTVRFKRDDHGKILKYRQITPNGQWKDFNPEDVIHIFFRRKKGFLVGTPILVPVADDIRALRRIEENIEMLIYQHLFPLYHYKVGTENAPAATYPDGTTEIDIAKQEVELMPAEGMIVTSERHEIQAIGVQGRALQAEGYLKHFKQRIFAGLGVSAVDMGEGECYDDETETLTDVGWKYHTDIDEGDKIATYNPETGRIEYHVPNSKYEGYYEGDMICFRGKHIDIKVTPHHEMWVCPGHNITENSKWRKAYAVDLYHGLYSEFCFLDSALPSSDMDEFDEEFYLPSVGPIRGRTAKPIKCNLVDFASLLGYFITEGCLDVSNAKGGRYRVAISQNRGNVLEDIKSICQRIGLSFSVSYRRNRDREATVKLYGKNIYKYFEENIGHLAENKNIPDFVFSWNYYAREALLKALVAGDGTIPTQDGCTSFSYFTSSKQLADDVQKLAFSLGYSCKIALKEQSENAFGEAPIYVVFIGGYHGKQYRIVSQDMISKESYSGIIYCYNVPNHLFVTRRGGKVTIQGNTANRSTADTLSRNMVDSVKHYQRIWEEFVNEYIIKELLLESTFTDPLDDANKVFLRFTEIDLDAKIKSENHSLNAFTTHAITHSELRRAFGREPLTDKEWEDMYWKRIEEPKALIQAVDEPYSVAAIAAARNKQTAIEEGDLSRSKEETPKDKGTTAKSGPKSTKKTSGERAVKSKDQPSNQHGTKLGPEKRKSSVNMYDFVVPHNKITTLHNDLRENMLYSLQKKELNIDWARQLILATRTNMIEELSRVMRVHFRNGFRSTTAEIDGIDIPFAFSVLETRCRKIIIRLTDKLMNEVASTFDLSNDVALQIVKITSIFDVLSSRTRFIYNSEKNKAYNYGVIRGLLKLGQQEADIVHAEDVCDKCLQLGGRINIIHMTIDDVPGFHPNCTCTIVPVSE